MHETPRPRWSDIAILMLGMGVAVTISWFAFADHHHESYSLDLASVLRPSRLLVYATQFLLIAGFVLMMVRGRLRTLAVPTLGLAVVAAWIGEGILLTVFGGSLVANELDPEIAWYYWLVATAGPLQPAVAFIAGWLGLRIGSAPAQLTQ
jgi:hypothetical protein